MIKNTQESSLNQIESIASTFSTDTIFILGKGPSADLIKPEVYASSLVIGINDAERIIPTDITIFYEQWVEKAIKHAGERSRLYVTSTDFMPEQAKVLRAPFMPISQEGIDLMFQRLLVGNIVVEEVMFLTALQICRHIANLRNRQQKVYMVGFDFSPHLGSSAAIKEDFSNASEDLRNIRIAPQENYFLNALYVLRETDIDVIHVGEKPYSRTTADQLNKLVSATDDTYDKLYNKHTVAIVAEMTTNHFGERYRLERIIRAAKAAGADYVKLQKRNVETFYTQEQLQSPYRSPFGKTFRDYRHAIELSLDDFEFVDKLCQKVGIGWFVSVLDKASFDFIMKFKPHTIKLPSTISEHKDYLEKVATTYTGNLVISTGMTDTTYENWILEKFSKVNNLYLLQCNSAYPTPLEHCNIAVVRHYHGLSLTNDRIVPGYSSHDLGWYASVLAVAAGARMVEKHVKLGNTEWAHFDAVAIDLTTREFTDYVDKIRETELILGSSTKKIGELEHHKYTVKK